MYDRGICKKECGRSAGRTSLSAQDCHLPAPHKVENCLKQFCFIYLFSIFLCLVLTKLSQHSEPVCKDLHASTCHFFWLS